VAKLIAKSALAGLDLPLTLGRITLSEGKADPIWSIAPYPGQAKAVANALKPLSFPAPNRVETQGDTSLVWAGRDMAFLIGTAPPAGLDGLAALTDQSDGWACLHLSGEGLEQVLARLVVTDTRLAAFPVGACAKVLFNHMQALIIRRAPAAVDILVFRSMARTAVHELAEAMTALAHRSALA
jgi:heterotetrameric sarcosine oxidase gamma subunit